MWIGASNARTGKAVLSEDQWQMLGELAEDNEYWEASSEFMCGIDGRGLSSLTAKQLDWYYNIDAGLDVELNRREARIAFGLEEDEYD